MLRRWAPRAAPTRQRRIPPTTPRIRTSQISAYLVVEFTVKDPDIYRDKYSAKVGQTAKQFGAAPVANGAWEVLAGGPALSSGAIMRFPDRQAALNWYNSPEYQELIEVRGAGMDARFSLVDGIPDASAA